jgi:hypothetical protein
LAQCGLALLKDGMRQTKRSKQLSGADVANAWRQGQAQPGGKFLKFHSPWGFSWG